MFRDFLEFWPVATRKTDCIISIECMIYMDVVGFIFKRNKTNTILTQPLLMAMSKQRAKMNVWNVIPLTNRCIFSYSCHVIVAYEFWCVIIYVADRYIYIAHSNKSTIVSLHKLQGNKMNQILFAVCIDCTFIL